MKNGVARFRKKPVSVDAMLWDGTPESALPIIEWILTGEKAAVYSEAKEPIVNQHGVVIRKGVPPLICLDTRSGRMKAEPGDWIVRGFKGNFYACKPDIFESTHEVVPIVYIREKIQR